MGQLDEVSAAIGELKALLQGVDTRLQRVETDVATIKDAKAKGWGVLTGLGLATGAIGAKAAALLGNAPPGGS